MKKSYLNSERNTVLSSKPSKAIRLFLMVCLLVNIVTSAATITSSSSGNWSSASTWTAVSMTGTITTSNASINITGTGTSFLTELAVGSIIKTSGGTTIGTVASIVSNTSLTLVANANSNNTGISFKAQVVPSSSDNVIIADGTTVTVDVNAVMKSIIVSNGATLTVNDGKVFTVGSDTVLGSFTVNSGGKFSLGSGGDHSTVIVYGNYTNNGETIFWKSDVIIRGDLISPSTSTLQKNGNVIVGGDIIGTFDTTGGNGTGQIYAVNPNATVTISPQSIDNNVNPGTFPSGETPALISLVNTVIYGGGCSFIITNVSNVSTCSGFNAVFTINTITGATYQWQVNKNDGAGWSNLTNDSTYSGVSTFSLSVTSVSVAMNNYKYRAKITSNGCAKNGNYGVLTVNAGPSAPTGSSSQTFCSGATVANLSASGTTIQWYAASSGGSPLATTLALVNGTHYYASQTTGCESSSRLDVTATVTANTWTGTTSSSWFTATNWSCGVPTASSDVTIPNATNKPIIDDRSKIALANTLTVASGSSLTVNSGNTIKVTDKVINNGGTITFENSASLVQINDSAVNAGVIKYKRGNTSAREEDFTYWSSPVANQKLFDVSPLTPSNYFYSFNPSANDWVSESTINTMNIGQGYIIRNPHYTGATPPGFYIAPFVGTPNNGVKFISNIVANASYLLGNPYPSAIDADEFLQANVNTLGGTLYFWTHNTAIKDRKLISNAGTGAMAYTSNDYATYNGTGGVGVIDTGVVTGSAPSDSNHSILAGGVYVDKGIKPTGKIAAGQGFFASSLPSATPLGDIVFNNSMRLAGTTLSDGTGVNQQFFKTKNPKQKTVNSIEKNRIWLNLTNTQGAFKQTLVGYITDATNEFDNRFDGESFDGNEFVDFYSVNQDKNLVIQGRALPFDENDTVPLGFRSAINGDFTINIDQTDGLLTNQAVFIEDKLTNTVFNLKSGNYTFSTVAGTFNDRFVLRYTDKTLSIDETDKEDGILVLYSNNYKTLIIHNEMSSSVNSVALFNITGQNVANWEVNDSEQTNIQIPIKNVSSGIYIVKVKTTKGESSKKIIIK